MTGIPLSKITFNIHNSYISKASDKKSGNDITHIKGILKYNTANRTISIDRMSTFINRVKSIFMGQDYFHNKINTSIRHVVSQGLRDTIQHTDHAVDIKDTDSTDTNNSILNYYKTYDHKFFKQHVMHEVISDFNNMYNNYVKDRFTPSPDQNKDSRLITPSPDQNKDSRLNDLGGLKFVFDRMHQDYFKDLTQQKIIDQSLTHALSETKNLTDTNNLKKDLYAQAGAVNRIAVFKDKNTLRAADDIIQTLFSLSPHQQIENTDPRFLFLLGKALIANNNIDSSITATEIKSSFNKALNKYNAKYIKEFCDTKTRELKLELLKLEYDAEVGTNILLDNKNKKTDIKISCKADVKRLILASHLLHKEEKTENWQKILESQNYSMGNKYLSRLHQTRFDIVSDVLSLPKVFDPYDPMFIRVNAKKFYDVLVLDEKLKSSSRTRKSDSASEASNSVSLNDNQSWQQDIVLNDKEKNTYYQTFSQSNIYGKLKLVYNVNDNVIKSIQHALFISQTISRLQDSRIMHTADQIIEDLTKLPDITKTINSIDNIAFREKVLLPEINKYVTNFDITYNADQESLNSIDGREVFVSFIENKVYEYFAQPDSKRSSQTSSFLDVSNTKIQSWTKENKAIIPFQVWTLVEKNFLLTRSRAIKNNSYAPQIQNKNMEQLIHFLAGSMPLPEEEEQAMLGGVSQETNPIVASQARESMQSQKLVTAEQGEKESVPVKAPKNVKRSPTIASMIHKTDKVLVQSKKNIQDKAKNIQQSTNKRINKIFDKSARQMQALDKDIKKKFSVWGSRINKLK